MRRQAAGSWNNAACCAKSGNDCYSDKRWFGGRCDDHTSASDWLFRLAGPGAPPAKFETTGTNTNYQYILPYDYWPIWGGYDNITVGDLSLGRGELGADGSCGVHGFTYAVPPRVGGTPYICGGGSGTWGKTDMETWRLADAPVQRGALKTDDTAAAHLL